MNSGTVSHTVTQARLIIIFFVFSSPEHKVLKVSYCDHPVSGVRRQSSVVRRQQFIQSTSPPKLLDQFQNNFTQMFP